MGWNSNSEIAPALSLKENGKDARRLNRHRLRGTRKLFVLSTSSSPPLLSTKFSSNSPQINPKPKSKFHSPVIPFPTKTPQFPHSFLSPYPSFLSPPQAARHLSHTPQLPLPLLRFGPLISPQPTNSFPILFQPFSWWWME